MERPILFFPSPDLGHQSKGKIFTPTLVTPSLSRQEERLSPQYQTLIDSFNARRAELQESIAGFEPEMALVIETRGYVQDFIIAVRNIEGLEWLGEIEIEDILPDDDYYDQKNKTKALTGRLYLIMTNQEALNQMVSLWKRYSQDNNMSFKKGQTKFRDIFLLIKEMRYWGVQDRLEETGIIADWNKSIVGGETRNIIFQIELWFRKSESRQKKSENDVISVIEQNEGRVLNRCILPEIAYHSILAELPIQSIQEIIKHRETRLTKCDEIMFFRPVGQTLGKKNYNDETLINLDPVEIENLPLPNNPPIIALLDGFPLENHALLSNRIVVDDPEGWESEYDTKKRYHGTEMASLIIHGDLNDGIHPISHRLYVRPILKPDPLMDGCEIIPEDTRLALDIIHQAVKRIIEGEDEQPPAAPTVKIINLSVCDTSTPFSQYISPLSRLLDWLSEKYKVLFIVSAGNQESELILNLTKTEFDKTNLKQLEHLVINTLYHDIRNRRLYAPADSINCLSVGAWCHDTNPKKPFGNLIELYQNTLPSPISPFGYGYRKSIKPDLIFSGGRTFYEKPLYNQSKVLLKVNTVTHSGPGNRVAIPGDDHGDLFKLSHDFGTSNAAALISRYAGFCYDIIFQMFQEQRPDVDYSDFIVPLIKAMTIHGCSWMNMGEIIKSSIINEFSNYNVNNYNVKNWISRWIGYGVPNLLQIQECTENRISLIGYGYIEKKQAHVYYLPLPPSLNGKRGKRRITITLAYLSPIHPSTFKYNGADLWFEIDNDFRKFSRFNRMYDDKSVRKGTVQHEIFESNMAIPVNEEDVLMIKVNCREEAGKLISPIPYGLIVSLEVAEELDVQVYNEVRTKIIQPIRINPIINESG